MGGDDRAAPPGLQLGREPERPRRAGIASSLAQLAPWRLRRRIEQIESVLPRIERRLDALEAAVRTVQEELAAVREGRLDPLERRADAAERALHAVTGETARIRDRVVPAAVARADALLERLAEELEETASLVERALRREPLPVAAAGPGDEERLAGALAAVQPKLLASFRGAEEEIAHRLDRYLPELRSSAPVLDLGCGRGELLLMLRDAGVECCGVESDPALAGAAHRRGLRIVEADVLEALRGQPAAAWGAVTAIHLFEHLDPAALTAVLGEARRVLRPGGLLIAECPNPHSLRVGASLFWQDPTHRRPLLPETLELFLESAGFELRRRELMHPFPQEQLLAAAEEEPPAPGEPGGTALERRLDVLCARLDELLNGPRDFAVWAARPVDPA